MSRKNVVKSYKMLDGAALNASQASAPTSVINQDKASIHLQWAGASGTSTVTVQARNGELDPWYDLDFGSAISITGASGEHQLIFNELPFTEIRINSSAASGGTVTATITMKQVGG